jgi:hypothetical protein
MSLSGAGQSRFMSTRSGRWTHRHRSARAVTHHVDRHELGLFERREMLAFMREAGLCAQFEPQGLMPDRGLYIAVKG